MSNQQSLIETIVDLPTDKLEGVWWNEPILFVGYALQAIVATPPEPHHISFFHLPEAGGYRLTESSLLLSKPWEWIQMWRTGPTGIGGIYCQGLIIEHVGARPIKARLLTLPKHRET